MKEISTSPRRLLGWRDEAPAESHLIDGAMPVVDHRAQAPSSEKLTW